MTDVELDTFDDGPYTEGFDEVEDSGEAEGQAEEETAAQEEQTEEVDADSQVNLLEEKEDEESEESEEDEEEDGEDEDEDSEEDEESESDEDGEDEESETPTPTGPEVKMLKAFSEGKRYEVPQNATIQTKVNGKSELVTIQELKDNYSGKVSYEEKFSKLDERDKSVSEREQGFTKQQEQLSHDLNEIGTRVKSALEGKGNPLEPLNYLLDLVGINTVHYNKMTMDFLQRDFESFEMMTPSEREAHWASKENTYLKNKQESSAQTQAARQAETERQQQVESMREAHGVSEEEYQSALKNLQSQGVDKITPEMTVRAAKITPIMAEVTQALDPYLDRLSDDKADDLAIQFANDLADDPNLTIDFVKEFLAEQFEVEDIVSEIKDKVDTTSSKTKVSKTKGSPKKEAHSYESFDDFDY